MGSYCIHYGVGWLWCGWDVWWWGGGGVCGVVVGVCVGGVVAAATEMRLMHVSECCSIQTHA